MATPFRTPTEVYTSLLTNADLRALSLASMSGDVSTEVALYDALRDAGETLADSARAANPDSTSKLITYNVVYTGTATQADIAAALRTSYTNGLAIAADVIAATATTAVTDLATVTAQTTFELSLDADPTGETIDLTIAAGELAYSTAASVSTVQTLYADVNLNGTAVEATIETIDTDYVEGLAAGAFVDQSALSALSLADAGVTAVNSLKLDWAATPTAQADITLAVGSTGTATAASITFTDAD
jgi:hypothetical protein